MLGLNKERSRLYLHDDCYLDLLSQKIVESEEGRINRRISIKSNKWEILKLLIENLQTGISVHEICSRMHMDEQNVRTYMTRLRNTHTLLRSWIPDCNNGMFRLEEPDSKVLDGYKKKETVSQAIGCTLRSTKIITRPNFVKDARSDVFEALNNAFTEHNIVFLHGLGGIGKSEIAKNWAIEQKKAGTFDTVVFAQLNTEENSSNVMSLLNDDTIFVISGDFRNRGDMISAEHKESKEDYFQRKLAKIKQICNEKTLIIIDNYDRRDPNLTKLFSGNYRLLITTRNEYDGVDFPFIHVKEIKNVAHLKRIFFKNLGDGRDDIAENDPYIEKLFALVSNHTLAIEILAKSLADAAEDTPESLYRKMSRAGERFRMCALNGEVENSVSDEPLSPFECIQILFNLAWLKKESDFADKEQVLAFMATMPTKGIELKLFREWSKNQTYRAAKSLSKKSWLRVDKVNNVQIISMHPLIKEIVWHDLAPSIEKCHDYLLKMANAAYDAWHREYIENISITSAVTSVLTSFGDPTGKYLYLYSPFIGILWQTGHFDQAIHYGHLLYESCVEIYGEKSMEAGFAAKSLAGCYFNCRRTEESVPWYKRGLDSMLASGMDRNMDIALGHEKVARCYTWECSRDFALAKIHFDKALSMYEALLSDVKAGKTPYYVNHQNYVCDETKLYGSIGGLHMEMGRMYQLMGNYVKALESAEEAYRIISTYEPDNRSSIAYTYFDKGVCLYHIGINNPDKEQSIIQLQEALEFLEKALKSNLRMRGELAVDTVDNHEMVADAYLALGRIAEAKKEYSAAINALHELIGKDCARAEQLRAKLLPLC